MNPLLSDDDLDRTLCRVLNDVFEGRLADPARGTIEPGPVLILPPDTTRIHSRAGFLSGVVCRELARRNAGTGGAVPGDGVGAEAGRWRLGAIMPALGTHRPLGADEIARMFPACPAESFIPHRWQSDTVELGRLDAGWVERTFTGLVPGGVSRETPPAATQQPPPVPPTAFRMDWPVEVNRLLRDGLPAGWRGGELAPGGLPVPDGRRPFSLIVSIGQVVPHEIAGMANHAKNIFVGTGGAEAIHKSHWLGALYGMERLMGKTENPVRALFDEALHRYSHVLPPILWVLSVVDYSNRVRGIFCGFGRKCFEEAAALAEQVNIEKVPCEETGGIRKAVVYLDPNDYRSTWLGNKAIYRTRKALAKGGELVILAPGLECFGEDPGLDALIRRYGYRGTAAVRKAAAVDPELAAKLSAAAHLIHGSSEGRFTIRYCTANDGAAFGGKSGVESGVESGGGHGGEAHIRGNGIGEAHACGNGGRTIPLSRDEIESVGYEWGNLEEAAARYVPLGPEQQPGGWNTTSDGERYYFIRNPGLGLWTV